MMKKKKSVSFIQIQISTVKVKKKNSPDRLQKYTGCFQIFSEKKKNFDKNSWSLEKKKNEVKLTS